MPKINILNILSGDNQSTVVDKINYNFDQILSAGGGPQGQQGLIGATGPVGPQGIPGIQGTKGDKGNKWFVASTQPTGASVDDYWLDVDSSDQAIYQYQGGSWVPSGFGLSTGDIFQRMTPIRFGSSSDRTAIILGGIGGDQTGPQNTSLVLSDIPINQVGTTLGYTPGLPTEAYMRNVNQEDSKLKITTKERAKLISFARAEIDVTSTNRILAGTNNPSIAWDNPGVTPTPYDISFKNPTGGISILTEGTSRGPIVIKSNSDSIRLESLGSGVFGGINISAQKEITSKSNSENISILTASVNKGTFIRFNSNASSPTPGIFGFVEFNNNTTSVANNNKPAFFANANGVGIGVGINPNFTFKQSGADARKLAVLGNVSIGNSPDDHQLIDMFVGINGQSDYNLGSLYVKGHGAFGHNDPRLGGTTGPAEAANQFPQLFVTTTRNGQVFQAKNRSGGSVVSRTTMGDGKWDYNTVADKTSAGLGPDLTQEFFVENSGYLFQPAPLISLQHKITNPTNVTDTATVFSITTFTINGSYNANTIADKTIIQTKNSNPNLRLFANASSTTNSIYNKVVIGARNKSLIAAFAGQDSMNVGTVSIGEAAEANKSKLIGNFDPNLVTFPASMINNHSLAVTGTLTIGNNNLSTFGAFSLADSSYGAFVFGGTINQSRPVGNATMLKIQRIFGTVNANGTVNGQQFDNLPNGLEIISYKNVAVAPSTVNRSVGLAIAAIASFNWSPSTGFFVSDDGLNVGINSFPSPNFGLKIGAFKSLGSPAPYYGIYSASRVSIDGDLDVGTYSPGTKFRVFEGDVNNYTSPGNPTRRYLEIGVSGDDYNIDATYNTNAAPVMKLKIGGGTKAYLDVYGLKIPTGNYTNPGLTSFSNPSTGIKINSTSIDFITNGVSSVYIDGRQLGVVPNNTGGGITTNSSQWVVKHYNPNTAIHNIDIQSVTSATWTSPYDGSWDANGVCLISHSRWTGTDYIWGRGIGIGREYQADLTRSGRPTLFIQDEPLDETLTGRKSSVVKAVSFTTNWARIGHYRTRTQGTGTALKVRLAVVGEDYDSAYVQHIQGYGDNNGLKITAGSGGSQYTLYLANNTGANARYFTASGGNVLTSDIRTKKNIFDIEDQLSNINKLRVVNYNWKEGHGDASPNIGFIAQEVMKIYPNSVTENNVNNYYSLNYESISVYAIKAIQELSAKVDKLEKEIKELKS